MTLPMTTMCTCPVALHYVPIRWIVHRHLVTTQNLNHNPRSIGVWLYIVPGKEWWMWTPRQVTVVVGAKELIDPIADMFDV